MISKNSSNKINNKKVDQSHLESNLEDRVYPINPYGLVAQSAQTALLCCAIVLLGISLVAAVLSFNWAEPIRTVSIAVSVVAVLSAFISFAAALWIDQIRKVAAALRIEMRWYNERLSAIENQAERSSISASCELRGLQHQVVNSNDIEEVVAESVQVLASAANSLQKEELEVNQADLEERVKNSSEKDQIKSEINADDIDAKADDELSQKELDKKSSDELSISSQAAGTNLIEEDAAISSNLNEGIEASDEKILSDSNSSVALNDSSDKSLADFTSGIEVKSNPIPKPANTQPNSKEKVKEQDNLAQRVIDCIKNRRIEYALRPVASLTSEIIDFQYFRWMLIEESGEMLSPEAFMSSKVASDIMPTLDNLLVVKILAAYENLGLRNFDSSQKGATPVISIADSTLENPYKFKSILDALGTRVNSNQPFTCEVSLSSVMENNAIKQGVVRDICDNGLGFAIKYSFGDDLNIHDNLQLFQDNGVSLVRMNVNDIELLAGKLEASSQDAVGSLFLEKGMVLIADEVINMQEGRKASSLGVLNLLGPFAGAELSITDYIAANKDIGAA